MARRGMTGQLNMFDFFRSLDDVPGEVEMVSLMPSFDEELEAEIEEAPEVEEKLEVEEEPKIEEVPEFKERNTSIAVMSRSYEWNGVTIEIAYLNYNKVRIQKGEEEPSIIEFDSSKEAVDYYVERMQELEKDE